MVGNFYISGRIFLLEDPCEVSRQKIRETDVPLKDSCWLKETLDKLFAWHFPGISEAIFFILAIYKTESFSVRG